MSALVACTQLSYACSAQIRPLNERAAVFCTEMKLALNNQKICRVKNNWCSLFLFIKLKPTPDDSVQNWQKCFREHFRNRFLFDS